MTCILDRKGAMLRLAGFNISDCPELDRCLFFVEDNSTLKLENMTFTRLKSIF